MIVLHDYWRSTASYRVRIALGLADLAWETRPVNLLEGAHSSQDHLAKNPQGLVPVLEIDGHVLTQSIAQIEYLNETRDLGLLPPKAIDRAHVRALASVIAMEIHPVCNLNVVKFAASESKGEIETKMWMQHFISKGLIAFEAMIRGEEYCFGTSVTLADICLVPQLYNADRWGVSLEELPKIRRVAKALGTLPAFAAAHPDRTPQT